MPPYPITQTLAGGDRGDGFPQLTEHQAFPDADIYRMDLTSLQREFRVLTALYSSHDELFEQPY
jgi:hypothetical protein